MLPRRDPFRARRQDSFQPVTNSPECEGVKGRTPASSESPVTCCWSGNCLFLIIPIVICPGKMLSHLLKAAVVFSKIICFQGNSMQEIKTNDSIRYLLGIYKRSSAFTGLNIFNRVFGTPRGVVSSLPVGERRLAEFHLLSKVHPASVTNVH